jgi:DNA mismatch endonuclease (patch repair protein)
MADVVGPDKRSRMMSGIQGKDTKPELAIRKALHARGFRYKLHDKALPGKPDMVFPQYRAAIQINGCFCHVHECHLFKWPTERQAFWKEKLEKNRIRDEKSNKALQQQGWRLLLVWECAFKGALRLPFDQLIEEIEKWVKSDEHYSEIRGFPKGK